MRILGDKTRVRLKHALYKTYAVTVFVPYIILVVASIAFEWLDTTNGDIRHWCYRENE